MSSYEKASESDMNMRRLWRRLTLRIMNMFFPVMTELQFISYCRPDKDQHAGFVDTERNFILCFLDVPLCCCDTTSILSLWNSNMMFTCGWRAFYSMKHVCDSSPCRQNTHFHSNGSKCWPAVCCSVIRAAVAHYQRSCSLSAFVLSDTSSC